MQRQIIQFKVRKYLTHVGNLWNPGDINSLWLDDSVNHSFTQVQVLKSRSLHELGALKQSRRRENKPTNKNNNSSWTPKGCQTEKKLQIIRCYNMESVLPQKLKAFRHCKRAAATFRPLRRSEMSYLHSPWLTVQEEQRQQHALMTTRWVELLLLSIKASELKGPILYSSTDHWSIDRFFLDWHQTGFSPVFGTSIQVFIGGEKRGDPRGRESSVFGASALCDITTGPISCMDPDVATKRGKIHTWILSEGTRHKLLRLLHNMGPLIGFYTQKLSNIFLFSSSCQEISAWFKD